MSDLSQVREVKGRHDQTLMAIPGVEGTGIGLDADGRPVIELYVERFTEALSRKAPTEVEGIPVRIVETGQFKAQQAGSP